MHSRFLPIFKRSWSAMLNLGFGLLCFRFLFAASRNSDWTFALFVGAGFAVAWWRPAASLFAFALCLALLSGLERTVLHVPYASVLVLASSLWLGLTARKHLPIASAEQPRPASAAPAKNPTDWMTRLAEILAMIALVWLFAQTWRQSAIPDFWTRFWQQSNYGTGDPAYFLKSGFLWLHGLFYFRAIREHLAPDIISPANIKLVFLVNGVVLLLFHGVQRLYELPARWNPGFESPYEDIATFGIMAVCSLLLCLALIRRDSARWLLVLIPGAVLLVLATVGAWSRGTWLAATVSLALLAGARLPRSLSILAALSVLGAVAFINLNLGKLSQTNSSALGRLITLVRFENLRAKDPTRFELYPKALAMIHERPWTGHGIGVFYLRAPAYARPEDSNGPAHLLPHNLLLQLATEQGVPVTLLFLGLVGGSLWCGAREWIVHQRRRPIVKSDSRVPSDPLAHLIFGLTLALAAYLQANMTWDILLIHPTQPFFFWFLMAALWATVERVENYPDRWLRTK